MSIPSIPDLGPNPFYDGPAVHSHLNCSYCHRFRRCEFERLQKCARCGLALYCSKDCQRNHWKEHKISCNAAISLDKEIEEKTGISHGYIDLMKWVEFYSTPMKNCVIASLNLPNYPHQERHSVVAVHIVHKRDTSLPVQHRFTIDAISRYNRGETLPTSIELVKKLDSEEMRKTVEFGKVEMGESYYGTAMFVVSCQFAESPPLGIPVFKFFAIEKHVARAKVMSGPWWPPLRYYLENGKKMKFCCGKIEGIGCCCGGWVHDEKMKGDAWR